MHLWVEGGAEKLRVYRGMFSKDKRIAGDPVTEEKVHLINGLRKPIETWAGLAKNTFNMTYAPDTP